MTPDRQRPDDSDRMFAVSSSMGSITFDAADIVAPYTDDTRRRTERATPKHDNPARKPRRINIDGDDW
ncbi:hypothetical protein CMI37_03835 [Candidatus Pacearchaeota archaeon]|nr:hypothetical protein [Candidatus Pacearchaeota archaeon]|tara:strand:+ start:340 stop:543 length:204 start_codon:yes stop_codon:yes gene_type:complete